MMFIVLSGQYPFHGKTKDKRFWDPPGLKTCCMIYSLTPKIFGSIRCLLSASILKDELLQKIRKEPVSFKNPRWKKITKDAKSSVAELLRKKPENRCSIADALRHSWLQSNVSLPSGDVMKGMVETMIQFQEMDMLQKAALTALAWRASDEDTQHLRQIFECLDQDSNGHVTMTELRGAFAEVGIELPADLSICGVGTDGNDTIEYTEFLAAALDKSKILKEDWESRIQLKGPFSNPLQSLSRR